MPLTNRDFCHLHLHTDLSMLDGVGRAEEYAALAEKFGQRAIACTDHGQLYGLPAMRRACAEHGLKMIPGCELYVNDRRDESPVLYKEADAQAKEARGKTGQTDIGRRDFLAPEAADSHLVVLAADQTGWHNLLKLNHDSINNGFYYNPRTTHDLICEHAEGLIATTACISSLFCRYLGGFSGAKPDLKKARALLKQFKDAFGDRFFYELHINELPQQKAVNAHLMRECKRLGIEPILTCDTHYACNCDRQRQNEVAAVYQKKKLPGNGVTREHLEGCGELAFNYDADHLWFQRPSDIIAGAKRYGCEIPKDVMRRALLNTVEIAERCDAKIYDDTTLKPPQYRDSAGKVPDCPFDTLKALAVEGIRGRFPDGVPDEYKARLKHELRVIRDMGMSEFYLVTKDVVDHCRECGIFVWTRGSGCGSLVSAAIGITNIDPIRFGLLFERFVDPSRPNAPDFDLDIDATRKQEVVDWLMEKYGGEKGERIARIISLTTYRLKSAIQDLAATYNMNRSDAYRVSDVCDRLDPKHEKALAQCHVDERERLQDECFAALIEEADERQEAWLEEHEALVRDAMVLVGRVRNKGLHAAGYVVAPSPLVEHLPIDRAKDPATHNVITITAWGEGQASQDIAETGLLKLDLLSLDTITVISDCIRLVKDRHGVDITPDLDAWSMDYADPKVMAEFATGNGFGLHQLNTDSQALAEFVGKLAPADVNGVIAAVAMYRPGPMQFCDTFIARSHGREEVPQMHPTFDAIVAETFGIMTYQEQVMEVLNQMGGIEKREAYGIVKAISKKKLPVIQAARERFISHSDSDDAPELFDHIEKFAGYGFNKAHSASYGILSYITAWLRAYYPLEFWLCWLNRTPNKTPPKSKGKKRDRKLAIMMAQAKRAGIKLHRPRIGSSGSEWRIAKDGSLVAPLSIILGVGPKTADATREAWLAGEFRNMAGFLDWAEANKKLCNAAAVKKIAAGGALARFKLSAPEAFAIAEEYGAAKPAKCRGTKSQQATSAWHRGELAIRDTDERRMAMEREALGFNYWQNPWAVGDREETVAKLMKRHPGRVVIGERNIARVQRPFCVTAIRKGKDRKQREMAFLGLVDPSGATCECVVFSSIWPKVKGELLVDGCYLLKGEYDGPKLLLASGRNVVVDVDDLELR
jgi:DNA polymerase-3 subunit alpha